MASWMTHLRIADGLLGSIGSLPQTHFIAGNIAPDSGEPNGDWSEFTPPKEFTHYTIGGFSRPESAENFRKKYLVSFKNDEEKAFYLGYYAHLLADYISIIEIFKPKREKYAVSKEQEWEFGWKIKQDMHDLDQLFLKEHPGFRAFCIFENISSFPNVYLDYFTENAFDKRFAYIAEFYRSFEGDLDSDYPYFTKNEIDDFIKKTTKEIQVKISELM